MISEPRDRDRTDEILRRHLDHDFACFAAHEDAPSMGQLNEVAQKYGCVLPEDFLAHSTGALAGVYVEVKEDVWPRPKALDVGPFWSFLYGLFVYGLARQIPDWMNMDIAAKKFLDQTGHSLVPCMKVVGDADFYLFDSSGNLVQWHHETDEFEPVGMPFFDLLDREVRELRERKDLKVARA